jgi:hypothetical protein
MTASVSLRLGNVMFVANVEALSAAGGMLAAMFAHGMRPGDTDTTGAILIQRDPTFFNYVMQYVHGESLELAMMSTTGLDLLAAECDYYQLPDLALTVQKEIEAREQLVAAEQRREAMKVQHLKSERDVMYFRGPLASIWESTKIPAVWLSVQLRELANVSHVELHEDTPTSQQDSEREPLRA